MKLRFEIIQDLGPMNPRGEFDNAGKMFCFHRRYSLGDKHNLTVEEVKAMEEDPANVALPLYLYDHSGLTIATKPFSCRWDSGRLGSIIMTKERIDREWNGDREKALKYLQGEVETYDQYLTGDIWGFRILDEDDNEMDSCWGFYGRGYCEEEAKSALERCQKQAELDEEETMVQSLNLLEVA